MEAKVNFAYDTIFKGNVQVKMISGRDTWWLNVEETFSIPQSF
jgi:hypothetical protein